LASSYYVTQGKMSSTHGFHAPGSAVLPEVFIGGGQGGPHHFVTVPGPAFGPGLALSQGGAPPNPTTGLGAVRAPDAGRAWGGPQDVGGHSTLGPVPSGGSGSGGSSSQGQDFHPNPASGPVVAYVPDAGRSFGGQQGDVYATGRLVTLGPAPGGVFGFGGALSQGGATGMIPRYKIERDASGDSGSCSQTTTVSYHTQQFSTIPYHI
jgi:hypothetical protein